MAEKIFGIDLGTTYSCISYVDHNGTMTVVANSEGTNTTPSVVYFESDNSMVVGQTAKDTAMVHPGRVIEAVKRFMGDSGYVFEVDGKRYRPEEISAFILRKVVADAEQIIGEKITDAVITCPAYFGTNEKEATRQAGILAGLNVRYVIPEPTAAAFAYGMDRAGKEVTLVYDLGGGTFDVTIIDITPEAVRVICVDGDHHLGGKDWDKAIVDYLVTQFENQTGKPAAVIHDDLEAYQELVSRAERAKIQLSSKQSVIIPVMAGGERISVELTREKFDELTEPLLSRTIDLMNAARSAATGKGYTKIDKVLLVGGSTYMPQVRQRLTAEFSGEIAMLDPNLIVAKGAALFGHKLLIEEHVRKGIADLLNIGADDVDLSKVDSKTMDAAYAQAGAKFGLAGGRVEEIVKKTVTNVTSKSFGLVVEDDDHNKKVNNLVVANDTVPAKITQDYRTSYPDQTAVNLEVMENVKTVGPEGVIELTDCTELGNAELHFTKALPLHSPVRVTFELSPDGLLRVYGEDLTTHQDVTAQFQTSAVMTEEQLEAARRRQSAISVT